MAEAKGGRLGHDPLARQTPRGIDGIIRDTRPEADTMASTAPTAQQAHSAPSAPTAPGKLPGRKGEQGDRLPRMTMAFAPDHMAYLKLMAAFRGTTVTRYIYDMIEDDRAKNADTYGQIRAIIDRGTK